MDYTSHYNETYDKSSGLQIPSIPALQDLQFLTPNIQTLLQAKPEGTLQNPNAVLSFTDLLNYQDKMVDSALQEGERLVKTQQSLQNALQEAQTGQQGLLVDLLKLHPVNEEALKSLGTATSILGARMTQVQGQPALMDSSGLLWSLLGSGAGYMLGGPLGSVVGGLLGSSVGGIVGDVVGGVGNVVSDVVDTVGDIFGGIF